MNDTLKDMMCPGEGELRAFAVDPLQEKWADLAAHIEACDRCRDAFAAVLAENDGEVKPTPEDGAFIKAFTAKHCRRSAEEAKRLVEFAIKKRMSFVKASGSYALAAAPAVGNGAADDAFDDQCGPNEEVHFVYAAENVDEVSGFWRAELTVPRAVRPETMVAVSVSDAERNPVADGVLRIAGCSLPIAAGAATLPFSLFLDGIEDTNVSFSRAGASPVAGRLLFF